MLKRPKDSTFEILSSITNENKQKGKLEAKNQKALKWIKVSLWCVPMVDGMTMIYIQVPMMMIIKYQNYYYYIKQRISWTMSLHATHNPWNKCPSTSSWLCLAHLQIGPNMKKIKFAWDAMDNYFTTICSRKNSNWWRENYIQNESQSWSMDKFNKYPMMIVR